MLTWRELTRKERANYYHNRLENDFPADEVKPLASIEMMYLRGIYLFCGFFEDDRPIGYACMMTPKEGKFTLLDYFAIDPALRGQGYGTKLLAMIRKEILPAGNSLMIEAEDPDYAESADDLATRAARIRFYEHAGMRLSDVRGYVFGVRYRIFTGGTKCSDAALAEGMRTAYHTMLPTKIYEKNIEIEG